MGTAKNKFGYAEHAAGFINEQLRPITDQRKSLSKNTIASQNISYPIKIKL